MSDTRTGVLSPECEAELKTWGFMSEQNEHDSPVSIYDEDGDFVVFCTPTINPYDLKTMLRYGRDQYKRGLTGGAIDMAARLRALLMAAPLEPTQ